MCSISKYIGLFFENWFIFKKLIYFVKNWFIGFMQKDKKWFITYLETARYKNNFSLGFGFNKSGGEPNCFFNSWNTCSHFSVHSNFFEPFNTSKNGWHLSVDLDTNPLSAATLPAKQDDL